MAALDDVSELTAQRFRRMSPGRHGRLPAVDMTGLPPGPRWPVPVQTAALLRFRHWIHPHMHRTYGDTFTLRLAPGGRPLVFFTRPEDTREIFAGDPEVFHAGRANAILGPVMGEHSLLLQDSADHKRARKLLMPAFNGHALRGYRELVRDVAAAQVATWPHGEEFRSLDRLNALTLEVILRVVFGVTDEHRLAQLRPRVNATVNISPAVLLGWGYPWLRRVGPWKATVDNQRELDRLMYAEIRERRTAPDLADRTDVLSRLIREGRDSDDSDDRNHRDERDGPGDRPADRLSDTELRDQLVTLLLAGHETTATALAWTLYEAGRDPELLARCQEAASAGDGGEEYLDAVLKESLRLHPVIPMVVRTLMQDTEIGGWRLPRGTTVGPSIIVSHRRPENHPDPERFRPERFLGQNPPANTWIPFGGGVRRCIGAGFSLLEGVVVLREVFGRFDVVAEQEDVPKVRNITSIPRQGARVRVTPRSPG